MVSTHPTPVTRLQISCKGHELLWFQSDFRFMSVSKVVPLEMQTETVVWREFHCLVHRLCELKCLAFTYISFIMIIINYKLIFTMKLFSNKSLIVYQLKFLGIKVIVLQIHTRVAYSNNNGNVNPYFDPLAFIKRIQRRKVSQNSQR